MNLAFAKMSDFTDFKFFFDVVFYLLVEFGRLNACAKVTLRRAHRLFGILLYQASVRQMLLHGLPCLFFSGWRLISLYHIYCFADFKFTIDNDKYILTWETFFANNLASLESFASQT